WSGSVGLLASGKPKKAPASDTHAWHCIPYCPDYISLGFHLWLEGEPTFAHLTKRFGVGELFAVLMLLDAEAAWLSSLARANGLLAGLLEGENQFLRESVESWRKDFLELAKSHAKRSKGLKAGPVAAAQERRLRARNNYAMLRERYGKLFRGDRPL